MAYTTIDNPFKFFNTVLYTGNATARTITGVGFQPDWVWGKIRSESQDHVAVDSVRGATKQIYPSDNAGQQTESQGLTGFASDGFTVGTHAYFNKNTATYVAWNWLAGGSASSNSDGDITASVSANTTAGFSIVKYTGNATNSTVGHGLGVTPQVLIVKNLDSTSSSAEHWRVQHHKVAASKVLYLNQTNAEDTNNDFQSTYPGTSTFSISSADGCNKNGEENIAYCFAEKQGYSKFGSYTGNGNADGAFVYTGFKPAFVIFKRTNGTGNWQLIDNKRIGFNVDNYTLYPNSNIADQDENDADILSNGFKLRGTGTDGNGSGDTYIYMAFAENPFVTSGTKAAGTAR
tara:strand:- start:3 stop:1043 length:1041 start_codon:yes stop_codon:yes gene_type:complete